MGIRARCWEGRLVSPPPLPVGNMRGMPTIEQQLSPHNYPIIITSLKQIYITIIGTIIYEWN